MCAPKCGNGRLSINDVSFYLDSLDRELIDLANKHGVSEEVCRIRMDIALLMEACGTNGVDMVRKSSQQFYQGTTLDRVCGCKLGKENDKCDSCTTD